jgi:hypothetical protein
MPSIWEEATRSGVLARLDRLTPESRARWGKFHCPAMLAHLNDSIRMALGELNPPPRPGPMSRFPLKQLIIYLMPWPKGVPTAPMLIARGDAAVFGEEVHTFRRLLDQLGSQDPAREWPSHPAFGRMSRRDWGVLGYRHVDHHFRQFGV